MIAAIGLYLTDAKGVGKFAKGDRYMIIQNAVYLLERCNITNMKYEFQWSLTGPNSIALATDIDAVEQQGDTYEGIEISESGRKKLEKIKYAMKKHDNSLTDARWMRLLGSVAYIGKASPMTSLAKTVHFIDPGAEEYKEEAKHTLADLGIDAGRAIE